jgi:carbon-monoxide dehydrogenase small subunit
MGAVEGHEVTTVEGYRETKRFAALSEAFAALSAVQCGFCIPGMVLAAEALLRVNPHPTEDEVRVALSGNICRCTGYKEIRAAVAAAEIWISVPR